jgi:phosphohistidine phosphatase
MRIVVVRHAIAVAPEDFVGEDRPDEARPLTAQGRRRMRRAARGLRHLVPTIDVLAASPYRRAQETAEIVAAAYRRHGKHEGPTTLAALVPDAPLEATRDWLDAQPAAAIVALVGHEPHLSRLIGWLLTGTARALGEMKRGGACLLECDGQVKPGAARLQWLLHAGQLRELR